MQLWLVPTRNTSQLLARYWPIYYRIITVGLSPFCNRWLNAAGWQWGSGEGAVGVAVAGSSPCSNPVLARLAGVFFVGGGGR